MSTSLEGKLVVAISSRALFDFEEENLVFEQGQGQHRDRAYMELQLQRLEILAVGGFTELAGLVGFGGFVGLAGFVGFGGFIALGILHGPIVTEPRRWLKTSRCVSVDTPFARTGRPCVRC